MQRTSILSRRWACCGHLPFPVISTWHLSGVFTGSSTLGLSDSFLRGRSGVTGRAEHGTRALHGPRGPVEPEATASVGQEGASVPSGTGESLPDSRMHGVDHLSAPAWPSGLGESCPPTPPPPQFIPTASQNVNLFGSKVFAADVIKVRVLRRDHRGLGRAPNPTSVFIKDRGEDPRTHRDRVRSGQRCERCGRSPGMSGAPRSCRAREGPSPRASGGRGAPPTLDFRSLASRRSENQSLLF